MIKRKQFRDRYVLATGYPWAVGSGDPVDIRMVTKSKGMIPVVLKWPVELWSLELPRYRLVLECVK